MNKLPYEDISYLLLVDRIRKVKIKFEKIGKIE